MQRRGDVSVGDVDLFIEWAPPNMCDSDMVAMFEEYKRSRAAHNAYPSVLINAKINMEAAKPVRT